MILTKIVSSKWPPYMAGPALAFLFIMSFYLLDSPLGISEGYNELSQYCRESIQSKKLEGYPPLVWQTGFLAGVLLGALVAAVMTSNWKFTVFPEDRKSKGIIASAWVTPIQGIVGGFLVMLGLLIAGDSFLGLWASAIQLSTGAWIFMSSIVIWGVIFNGIINMKVTPPTVEKEGEGSSKGDKKK